MTVAGDADLTEVKDGWCRSVTGWRRRHLVNQVG